MRAFQGLRSLVILLARFFRPLAGSLLILLQFSNPTLNTRAWLLQQRNPTHHAQSGSQCSCLLLCSKQKQDDLHSQLQLCMQQALPLKAEQAQVTAARQRAPSPDFLHPDPAEAMPFQHQNDPDYMLSGSTSKPVSRVSSAVPRRM